MCFNLQFVFYTVFFIKINIFLLSISFLMIALVGDGGIFAMKKILSIVCFLMLNFSITTNAQIELGVEDISGVADNNISSDNSDNKSNLLDNALNLFDSTKKEEPKEKITVDMLKEKADGGDIQSQLDLGYMFLYGSEGVNIDYKQALHYYGLAANNKSPVALNNMGSLYFNGIGTEVDYEKAIGYFEEAAKLGSNDAAVNLAIIYLGDSKKNKTSSDWQKIYDLLEQAQQSNYAAKYLLGYSYYKGFLVNQDYIKAFKLIKEAADNQYDEAQYVLSEFYISGNGTTKNYNHAVKYLRLAVAQGHLDAIIKLADILSQGKIYNLDIINAHILYNVAAVMGSDYAAKRRDLLEQSLKIEDLLSVQANAENYKPEISKQTSFIRQTFGNSLKAYIDMNIENTTSSNLF